MIDAAKNELSDYEQKITDAKSALSDVNNQIGDATVILKDLDKRKFSVATREQIAIQRFQYIKGLYDQAGVTMPPDPSDLNDPQQ
jgi:hypothetical protein